MPFAWIHLLAFPIPGHIGWSVKKDSVFSPYISGTQLVGVRIGLHSPLYATLSLKLL